MRNLTIIGAAALAVGVLAGAALFGGESEAKKNDSVESAAIESGSLSVAEDTYTVTVQTSEGPVQLQCELASGATEAQCVVPAADNGLAPDASPGDEPEVDG
jgi:hypothetical protein